MDLIVLIAYGIDSSFWNEVMNIPQMLYESVPRQETEMGFQSEFTHFFVQVNEGPFHEARSYAGSDHFRFWVWNED